MPKNKKAAVKKPAVKKIMPIKKAVDHLLNSHTTQAWERGESIPCAKNEK